MENNELLGLSQAARKRNMLPSLLAYYISSGRGPKFQEIGGRKFFSPEDVATWKPEKHTAGRKPKQKKVDV